MSQKLFIAWQDPASREWIPVGRLTQDGGIYSFVYTNGALVSNMFECFSGMPEKDNVYHSETLFPLFANRLLSKSRPEYNDFLTWLGLTSDTANPFNILSLTTGVRGTDNLEIFQCPDRTPDGNYEVYFFARSLSHLPQLSVERANALTVGERLFLMHDFQNAHDRSALVLRSADPVTIVGYCPRYYAADFLKLSTLDDQQSLVSIERVNREAPRHLRLLCKFVSNWPQGFIPCSQANFSPIPRWFP